MEHIQYKVNLIIGQRTCRWDGEYAPEVLDCWDEYTTDENPAGFQEALDKAQARVTSGEFSAVRVFTVSLPAGMIDKALKQQPIELPTISVTFPLGHS